MTQCEASPRLVDTCVPATLAGLMEGACVPGTVTDSEAGVAATGVLRSLPKAGLCPSSRWAGLPPPFVGTDSSTF